MDYIPDGDGNPNPSDSTDHNLSKNVKTCESSHDIESTTSNIIFKIDNQQQQIRKYSDDRIDKIPTDPQHVAANDITKTYQDNCDRLSTTTNNLITCSAVYTPAEKDYKLPKISDEHACPTGQFDMNHRSSYPGTIPAIITAPPTTTNTTNNSENIISDNNNIEKNLTKSFQNGPNLTKFIENDNNKLTASFSCSEEGNRRLVDGNNDLYSGEISDYGTKRNKLDKFNDRCNITTSSELKTNMNQDYDEHKMNFRAGDNTKQSDNDRQRSDKYMNYGDINSHVLYNNSNNNHKFVVESSATAAVNSRVKDCLNMKLNNNAMLKQTHKEGANYDGLKLYNYSKEETPTNPVAYDCKINNIDLLKDHKHKNIGGGNVNNTNNTTKTSATTTMKNLKEPGEIQQQQQQLIYNYPNNPTTYLSSIYNKTINEEIDKRRDNYSNKSEEEVTSSHIEHKFINNQSKAYGKLTPNKEFLTVGDCSGSKIDRMPAYSSIPSVSPAIDSTKSTKYLIPSHSGEYTKNTGKSENDLIISTVKSYENINHNHVHVKSDSFMANKIQKAYEQNSSHVFEKDATAVYGKFENKIRMPEERKISIHHNDTNPSSTHGHEMLPIKNSYNSCNENMYPNLQNYGIANNESKTLVGGPPDIRKYPDSNMYSSSNAPSRIREEHSLLQNRLYSNTPNFSTNQFEQKNVMPSAPSNGGKQLSKLHMNPPDFTKQSVTAQNFEEISKKYNYIKDLRLKNPGGNNISPKYPSKYQQDDRRNIATHSYNTLYVKTPDFSAENVNKAVEQPVHHYPATPDNFNLNPSRIPSTSTPHDPNAIYTRKYPQLSHDVEMSVVPKNKITEQFQTAHLISKASSSEKTARLPDDSCIERFHTSPIQFHQTGAPKNSKKRVHPLTNNNNNNEAPFENPTDRKTYGNYRDNINTDSKNIKSCISVIQSRTDQGLNSPGNLIHNNMKSVQQPVSNWHSQHEKSSNRKQFVTSPQNNLSNNPTVVVPVSHNNNNNIHSPQMDTVNMKPSDVGANLLNATSPWQSNEKIVKSGHMKPTHQINPVYPQISFPGHSPIYPQPSHKSSPSPITAPSINFERPYAQSEMNMPSYYKNNSYVQHHQAMPSYFMTNKERPSGSFTNNEVIDVEYHSQKKQQHYQENEMKTELEYHLGMPNLDQKNPTKRIECAKTYPNQQHPVQFPSPQLPQPITKRSTEPQNNTKMHNKPNYREMINNYCAMRTSEDELNLEIIKRTLNRDVSLHKSDNDLSKNIFDSPVPTKMNSSTSSPNVGPSYYPNHDAKRTKAQHIDFEKRKPHYADTTSEKTTSQHQMCKGSRKSYNLPIEPRNDISVTVSKVPTIPDRLSFPDRPMLHSMLENPKPVVGGKVNERNDKSLSSCKPASVYTNCQPVRTETTTLKTSSASPLDLSVKTVKTKADSTGCDDTKVKQRIRNTGNLHSAPKVDFSPNFANTCRPRSDNSTRMHFMTSFTSDPHQSNNKNITAVNSIRKNDEMLPPPEKKPLPYKVMSANSSHEINRHLPPKNYPSTSIKNYQKDIENSQYKVSPKLNTDKYLNSNNFEKDSNYIYSNKSSQFQGIYSTPTPTYDQSYSPTNSNNKIFSNECPTTTSDSAYMNYVYNMRDDIPFRNYPGKPQKLDINSNKDEINTIQNTNKLTYYQPSESHRYTIADNDTKKLQPNIIPLNDRSHSLDKATTIPYPNKILPTIEVVGKQMSEKKINHTYKAELDNFQSETLPNPNFTDKCSNFIDEKRITSVIQTGKTSCNNNQMLGYIHSSALQQQQQVWYPPAFDMNNKQQLKTADENQKNIIQQKEETPKSVSQYIPLPNNVPGSNSSGILKTADQAVITKLRNGIEMREYEKQQKQSCKPAIDDTSKTDIASLLAARIRTKGELKVFNPIPINNVADVPLDFCFSNTKTKQSPSVTNDIGKVENSLALDMLSWGSACNDFVEQLKCGENKKRIKKRPVGLEKIELSQNNVNENLTVPTIPEKQIKIENSDSSDEDKPLQQLRQQKKDSINENSKIIKKEQSSTVGSSSTTMNSTISENLDPKVICQNSLIEKLGRNLREKRMEQEKRLAARLGKESSSDSEDKKQNPRPKKLKKPRSRQSNATSTKEISETDSSGAEELSMTRNLVRSRAESRKRKFHDSDRGNSDCKRSLSAKKLTTDVPKIDGCERKEILTKAEMKFMVPARQSMKSPIFDKRLSDMDIDKSIQDDDEELNSKCFLSIKRKTVSGGSANTISKHDGTKNKITKLSKTSCKSQDPDKELCKQETMTRSKKKKEIEKQIANSKILRNDKVIRNIFLDRKLKANEKPKLKSFERTKYCSNQKISDRRQNTVQHSKDGTNESSAESEVETVSDRLRSRKFYRRTEKDKKRIKQTALKKCKARRGKTKADYKTFIEKASMNQTRKFIFKKKQMEPSGNNQNTAQFPPGWEDQVIEYKKSLKVPLSLITIKGPPGHRISTSLPDLDSHSSDNGSDKFQSNKNKSIPKAADNQATQKTAINKKCKSPEKLFTEIVTKENDCKINTIPEILSPQSIIDVLHSRVIKSKNMTKAKPKTSNNTERKILNRGSNELEMLPSPLKDSSESVIAHHNVFDTEVLKSRTRTESRNLKNKELIREVFGGEDRPASAPPEIQNAAVESVTFEEKYEQYLKKMNVDFVDKMRKMKTPLQTSSYLLNKDDENAILSGIIGNTDDDNSRFSTHHHHDDISQDVDIKMAGGNTTLIKDETQDTNRETVSVVSDLGSIVTQFSTKRKKGTKYRSSRRKGSSGFDYIRKKKKPQTITSGASNPETVKRKKLSPVEFLHGRNENDVSKEIQKWVLNKSVGQSALHKAARLGYLDVIVYCLERMGMNPDPKDNAGYTPLHEACSKGRIDIARVLLQYGANHSETAHSGIRPLHEASENGYIEIVRLLLSYGADPLLTTYSGQTPLMLAENNEMEQFIKNHLYDVQNTGPHKQPWKFPGPWKLFDPDENGFNILDAWNEDFENFEKVEKVESLFDTTTKSGCDEEYKNQNENSTKWNIISSNSPSEDVHMKCCLELEEKISEKTNSENKGEIFELEEADVPLPPLYLLKDEGSEKWVLLSDLCNILKVKSKETLMKQICPSIPPSSVVNKALLRELKMSDFLEKATCLQLLCAGEKINVRASKVILVKYNERVQTLLGVRTILMKF